jgi:hypothetical protein
MMPVPLGPYLVIRTRALMAEEMFMFATTTGFMIGLGVLLFIVTGRISPLEVIVSYLQDKQIYYFLNERWMTQVFPYFIKYVF